MSNESAPKSYQLKSHCQKFGALFLLTFFSPIPECVCMCVGMYTHTQGFPIDRSMGFFVSQTVLASN